MEKMKQNKNTSVNYRVACASLTVIILLFIFTIPTFAVSQNGADFTGQPIPYSASTNSVSDQWSAGIPVARNSDGSRIWRVVSNASNADIYCFALYNGSNFYVVSETNQVYANFTYLNQNSNSYGNSRAYINRSQDTDGLYYVSIGSTYVNDSSMIYVPLYSSLEEGLAAVRDIIDNPPGIAEEFNMTISPGYALFIDIHGLSGVQGSLSTSTSKAFASPHTSNQTLSYQNAIPSGNVSPQGNGINWQGYGNKDLFGRYKSWSATLIPNNYKYIAIYNPVHIDTYVDPEHEDFNGAISVHVNKAYSETTILVPLNTELTGTGTVGTVTTEDQKPVVYDETTGTWIPTNQDGTPYTPSPYGDYMPSTVNSIHDWLQNIANLISGFFNGAIGAVTTLVGAGSAFINQLVSLYSWLPAPVYAVLSSALILVITIGVIKVFI